MLSRNVVRATTRSTNYFHSSASKLSKRELRYDGRNRLSNFWTPTQLSKESEEGTPRDGHDLLLRAGFLRQAHAGIFHLLPLGLRVQNKIEKLIDKHMLHLGASKVSLSSLSSEELWQRSGRLDKGRTSELLRLQDRKGAKYLLSPTHEEEITTIIANAVQTYKQLPIRLYQISRKYRDEPRPRQGLLRGREFLMKDLYTFDISEEAAHETYEAVREAYVAFLEDLKLPYLVARADSGNMGGTLSHEYHFASPQGEDTIITCDKCDISINEELYVGQHSHHARDVSPDVESTASISGEVATQHYISKDRTKLCSIHHLAEHGEPNIYAVKAIFPQVDASLQGDQAIAASNSTSKQSTTDQTNFRDPRLPPKTLAKHANIFTEDAERNYQTPKINGEFILLTKAREGDQCQSCREGKIHLKQAVEIGHTFHLGTRYSEPFDARIWRRSGNKQTPVEMGCHGIGVSRLIGAIANLLADSHGLNWPLAISPYSVVVIPSLLTERPDAQMVYDKLSAAFEGSENLDVMLDDREDTFGWRMKDADAIGYPFIVVLGNAWGKTGVVQLQCRRLGVRKEVALDELVEAIREYSKQL